ncbi:MAG: hypothetical protein EBQ96_09505 [Proteobacteria bacterium]|nr:hypothetical protein [Pseudomonadota bacterium]
MLFAMGAAGCSTTRHFTPTTCEDVTILKNIFTGEEIGRNRHEFSNDCLAGLISTAIVRAAQATRDPTLRERMLNVAAAAYQRNPSMRRDIDLQLKEYKIDVNLLTRPTNILFAPHPTDRTKTIMYKVERVGVYQGLPALVAAA